jgi:hypothetical protein
MSPGETIGLSGVEKLRQASGAFIADLAAWTHFGTLTFDLPVSDLVAARVLRDWARAIAREVHVHVWIAWGTERQRRGVLHFHNLFAIPSDGRALTVRAADRLWKHCHRHAGFTRIEPYEPGRGAAWYLSKGGDWDANVACPRPRRCKRTGRYCVEAPSPW